MSNKRKRNDSCKIFKQFLPFFIIFLSIGFTNKTFAINRGPANYVPDEEMSSTPFRPVNWAEIILKEDDAGVLRGVKGNLQNWQEKEEYRKNWNVESTGLYDTPDREGKKAYLSGIALKYADKRLAGEIKNAEEGSTLKRVGQMQKALRPKASVSVNNYVKLRFRARVIEGKGKVIVQNPFVEAEGHVDYQGNAYFFLNKNFSDIGFRTHVQYHINQESYETTLDKSLTSNLLARASSKQSSKDVAFGENSHRIYQLLFNMPF